MPTVRAYLGLGSNLNDPPAQLRRALRALNQLPHTRLYCYSGFYRSPPLHAPGVPVQADYVNAVAGLDTALSATALLTHLHALEHAHGRVRPGLRWGPRPLDLDILLYGDLYSTDPQLRLPHPGLSQRAFVLYPLLACAPDLRLPNGQRLVDLCVACSRTDLEYLGLGLSFD
jgi:2-amino-4-hydroxy-6-hydroxymethyldihydropteridine diphosphokinase